MTSGDATESPGPRPHYIVEATTLDFTELDLREQRLLEGALKLHALIHRGERLVVTVLRGRRGDLPVLTGTATTRSPSRDRERLGDITLSCGPAATAVETLGGPLVLDLGSDTRLMADVPPQGLALRQRAVRGLREHAPVMLDALWQLDTDRLERAYRPSPVVDASAAAPNTLGFRPMAPVEESRPRAVLFGMWWLETGGAESWAIESVAAARRAGLLPIVLTDHASPHPLLEREEFEDLVFLPITHGLGPGQNTMLLQAIFSQYDVRLVHLHHSHFLYEALPWIRAHYPRVPVIDSLHIREWRGGGIVDLAIAASPLIDTHHVISPGLATHLQGVAHIEAGKVVMRPLATLSGGLRGGSVRKPTSTRPTTVGFVGRLTQQKRPFLMLALAQRLNARAPGKFRFVMHGDGELEDVLTAQVRRRDLAGVLERRHASQPVAETYAESDIILLPSENEGLALVSFEAIRAGCLVLATDVGSQSTVIPPDALLPRHPYPLLRRARRLIVRAEQGRSLGQQRPATRKGTP